MNEQPKRKLGWRLLRWGLIGLAVLVTLAAVLVTEENWRGKRDWENYKRDAEARGERFDWQSFAPTNLPADSNIISTPASTNLVMIEFGENPKIGGTNINDFLKTTANQTLPPRATNGLNRFAMRTMRDDGIWPKETPGDWTQGKLTDLKNWQAYYRTPPTNSANEFLVAPQPQSPAADVLLALSKYDSAIEELRAASRQPFARFGGRKLDEQFIAESMNYFSESKGRCQVIRLRAVAELADNQAAKALDDIELLLRLDDGMCQEPLLIAQLVGIAETAMTLQPIFEGLAQHRWNDAQLAELEHALAAMDFLANFPRAMRGERAFAITSVEDQRITREFKYADGDTGKTKSMSLRWTPAAFFYQNELAFAQLYEQSVFPLVDLTNRTVSPAAIRQNEADVKAQLKYYSIYKIQALMLFPAVSASVKKFATIQVQVDLARVACALERFHLANGNYPETLDALTPQFMEKIPHDIIGGEPLRYRRTDDLPSSNSGAASGNFLLYSVGWNETDDGGQVVLTKTGTVDREKGDWVWKN